MGSNAHVVLVPVMRNDIRRVASRLRDADRNELVAASGLAPVLALARSVRLRGEAWTIMVDGRAEGACGVARAGSQLASVGVPWFVATDVLIRKCRRQLLRKPRLILKSWLREYNELVNYVDVRHTAAVHWLEHIGATLDEPEPYGPFKMPFRRFVFDGDSHV